MFERLVEPALQAKHLRKVAMTHGRLSAFRDRPHDAIDRLCDLAASKMIHAQTMQRVAGVLGGVHAIQFIAVITYCRHCEEQSDEAIHSFFAGAMDCFAALAMTILNSLFHGLFFRLYSIVYPSA
jgi:hypothetical protein